MTLLATSIATVALNARFHDDDDDDVADVEVTAVCCCVGVLRLSFRDRCISLKSISLLESIDWIEVLLIMRRFRFVPRHLIAVSCWSSSGLREVGK